MKKSQTYGTSATSLALVPPLLVPGPCVMVHMTKYDYMTTFNEAFHWIRVLIKGEKKFRMLFAKFWEAYYLCLNSVHLSILLSDIQLLFS